VVGHRFLAAGRSFRARLLTLAIFGSLFSFGISINSCGKQTRSAPSRPQTIYGDDNRQDIDPARLTPEELRWVRGVAAMIPTTSLLEEYGEVQIQSPRDFAESRRAAGQPLCADEPFQHQPDTLSLCTAFLIDSRHALTATHCVASSEACRNLSLVFDLVWRGDTAATLRHSRENVYRCVEWEPSLAFPTGDVVKLTLDRPSSRPAARLKRRDAPRLQRGDELFLISHPLSLPLKIARDGHVLGRLNPTGFLAALDAFGGSSGAPVINARTRTLEGILLGGESDFEPASGCWKSRHCGASGEGCSGERVDEAQGTIL
jgi:hypothetical protein